MVVDNRDPWGHAFVYSVRDRGKTVTIWSIGPNGRDEQGQGDDIVVNERLEYLLNDK
jgi:hypothetical protein